ncbi:MAG: phosphoribosyl-ATP diphosphatase [Eggerthellaceae bacterium]|nr:phosphoribosyl-ATP diphosphatase [Eggerthellaceae bacterium]
MTDSAKTYVSSDESPLKPATSQIGATMETLASAIAARRNAGEESYTHRLLAGDLDKLLKKVCEESLEVSLAAKETQMLEACGGSDDAIDASVDHMRYEAADVVYHLLVVLERFGVSIDEFAAELNMRMTEDERPEGAVRLLEEHIRRGK